MMPDLRSAKRTIRIDIDEAVRQYSKLSEEIKLLEKRKEELSNTIKNYAIINFSKDSNGSYYGENDDFMFGSTSRKSVNFDLVKSEKILKRLGYWNDATKTVIVKEKVDELYANGKITDKDIENMCVVGDPNYSVLVKRKEKPEEMPTIKTTRLVRKR